MGLQLIFVVETNDKCKSDWIYIKDTIERFFYYDQTMVKLSPVYMNGKGNYKGKEKQITRLIDQYRVTQKENRSVVIYCFDCDDYDKKPEDMRFLQEVQRYCEEKHYEMIWFCKDIESVYLGRKVEDSKKQKEAAQFKSKKMIGQVSAERLNAEQFQVNRSNFLRVVGAYLERK